jgi:SNF2 family DNA or RNA helicase
MSLAIQVHYRTKINVCVLIAKNSIKEKILKIQEKKAALAVEILASGEDMAFLRQ